MATYELAKKSALDSVREMAALADTVFETTSEASAKSFAPDVQSVEIIGADVSEYVRAASEPAHLAKFRDASGQWWVKQNSWSVSALSLIANQGADIDHHAGLQGILDFMRVAQSNVGQELDLCGLQWGVTKPLVVPTKVRIKNGHLKALGDFASWTGATEQEAVIKGRSGSSRVHLDRVEINCNAVANGLDESSSNSSRVSFIYIENYVDYGMRYTGGGCYWTNFIVYKFNGTFPQRTRKSARTGYAIDIQGVDGRISSGAVQGKIRTSGACHHMTITQLHGWDSSGVKTDFTNVTGTGNFTTTWQVDGADDLRVKKNGSVQTEGVGYTVAIDAQGYPTITVAGLVASDTVSVFNCQKDITSWEIRGYGCTFNACYIDNGYVDIYNMDNHFTGTGLYLSDYVTLDAHVRLWATSENQSIGNLRWEVRRAAPSLPVFKLMAEPGASWREGAAAIEAVSKAQFSSGETAEISGDAASSVVKRIISQANSGRALMRFMGATTTSNTSIGAEANDFIIMTNGVIVGRFTSAGHFSVGEIADYTIRANGHVRIRNYSIANLPSATQNTRCLAWVNNPAEGKGKLVISNGTVWEYMDGTPVA